MKRLSWRARTPQSVGSVGTTTAGRRGGGDWRQYPGVRLPACPRRLDCPRTTLPSDSRPCRGRSDRRGHRQRLGRQAEERRRRTSRRRRRLPTHIGPSPGSHAAVHHQGRHRYGRPDCTRRHRHRANVPSLPARHRHHQHVATQPPPHTTVRRRTQVRPSRSRHGHRQCRSCTRYDNREHHHRVATQAWSVPGRQ